MTHNSEEPTESANSGDPAALDRHKENREQPYTDAMNKPPGSEQASARSESDFGQNVESPEDQLRREVGELNDRWLRSQAEIENVRRRARRDSEEQAKFAAQSVIGDLLEVVDNLNRAINAGGEANANDGLVVGVKMVIQQFEEVLKRHGCHRISVAGEAFDPNFHEALQMVPSPLPSGSIVQEVRIGYRMHDRVLRPAQVIISAGQA